MPKTIVTPIVICDNENFDLDCDNDEDLAHAGGHVRQGAVHVSGDRPTTEQRSSVVHNFYFSSTNSLVSRHEL